MMEKTHCFDAVVRVRPPRQGSTEEGVIITENSVKMTDLKQEFRFSQVFECGSSQHDLYSLVQPHLHPLFEGHSSTFLAYGASGSGKSYTLGTQAAGGQADSNPDGIAVLAVKELFRQIASADDKLDCEASISLLEIYQEKVYDLLEEKKTGQLPNSINVQLDKDNNLNLQGLRELVVNSARAAITALRNGLLEKRQSSHVLFTLNLESLNIHCKSSTKAKLTFVDLSSPSKIMDMTSAAQASSNHRQLEGRSVNSSLLSLGNVIAALASRRQHVPFQSSELTRVLQGAINGCKYGLAIVCAELSRDKLQESCQILSYAKKFRHVGKTSRVVNARTGPAGAHAEDEPIFDLDEDDEAMQDKVGADQQQQEEINGGSIPSTEPATHPNKTKVTKQRLYHEAAIMTAQQDPVRLCQCVAEPCCVTARCGCFKSKMVCSELCKCYSVAGGCGNQN